MSFSTIKINGKKNGMAYIAVLVGFVIILIFITIVYSLFNSNLLQSKHQEKNIQAYYVARAGIDLTISALMQKDAYNNTLLNETYGSAIVVPATLSDTIALNNGSADIVVSSRKDVSNKRWVVIQSTGTLTGTSISRELKFQFMVDNPEVQKWN